MEVKKLWFENDKIYILTTEGETLWQSLLWYPRLLHASDSQREKYSIDAMGIRWEELDEDISIESFEYDDPCAEYVIKSEKFTFLLSLLGKHDNLLYLCNPQSLYSFIWENLNW